MNQRKRTFTLTEADRAARDLQRMQEINKWALWPWLPVKRRIQPGTPAGIFDQFANAVELGAVHADHVVDGSPRVYAVNVMAVGYFPAPDAKFVEYKGLSDLIADGWMID